MSLKIGSAKTELSLHEKMRRSSSSRQFGMTMVVSFSGPGDLVMCEADGEAGVETLAEVNLGDSEASKPGSSKSGVEELLCEGIS